jgi:uncharacterized membrane protein YphA (DoxX/SURF4 family)
MNTFLWTLQLVLGVLFTLHGAALLIMPPQLKGQLASLPYPQGFLRFIGLCELLGALGLILPWWLGVVPVLTPLAAAGLAVIMVGAAVTHMRASEVRQVAVTSALALLLVVIVFARWGASVL